MCSCATLCPSLVSIAFTAPRVLPALASVTTSSECSVPARHELRSSASQLSIITVRLTCLKHRP